MAVAEATLLPALLNLFLEWRMGLLECTTAHRAHALCAGENGASLRSQRGQLGREGGTAESVPGPGRAPVPADAGGAQGIAGKVRKGHLQRSERGKVRFSLAGAVPGPGHTPVPVDAGGAQGAAGEVRVSHARGSEWQEGHPLHLQGCSGHLMEQWLEQMECLAFGRRQGGDCEEKDEGGGSVLKEALHSASVSARWRLS
eukprot:scaffold214556_cov24-Tisochrysis_lutea.AAC.1